MADTIKLMRPFHANAMVLLSRESPQSIKRLEIYDAKKTDLSALNSALASIKHLLAKDAYILVVSESPMKDADSVKTALKKAAGVDVEIGSTEKASPGYYLKMENAGGNVNKTKSADKAFKAAEGFVKG